jgi:hypothetical protein
MKNKPLKKSKREIDTEFPKWQKGDYDPQAKFENFLPSNFLMICKLTNILPRTVLVDFMDNLSCGSWKREGRDNAKGKLIEYILEMGYGNELYTQEDLKLMFKEMDSIGLVFPNNGKMKLI